MIWTSTRMRRGPVRAAAGATLVLALSGLSGCGNMPLTPGDSDKAPANSAAGADETLPSTTPSLTQPPYPTGSPGVPRGPLPANVDEADPDAVAQAALHVMYAMDTTIDTTPYDATVRAAPYLTPEYAAELKAHQPAMAPGAQWDTWTSHHAYTTAMVTPAEDPGRPPDTRTMAYRQYTVTTVAHGDGGYTDTSGPGATAFVELIRVDGGPWRVTNLLVR